MDKSEKLLVLRLGYNFLVESRSLNLYALPTRDV